MDQKTLPDRLIVSQPLHLAGTDRDALLNACMCVGIDAAQVGPVLTVVHGGTTAYAMPISQPRDQR